MSSNVSESRDKQSLNYIIRSGLAGGFAGCVAKTLVAPLDRVKILFQASNPDFQKYAGSWSGAFRAGWGIYDTNGVRGLFQGHSMTLLRIFPYAAIRFMAYDQIHHTLMPTREDETNFRRFAAGSISGVISVFFTYPLEVIRVRMAFQTSATGELKDPLASNVLRTVHQMYHERPIEPTPTSQPASSIHAVPVAGTRQILNRFPILKFYRGFTATIIGMIPYAGVSFLSWGYLRARFIPYDSKPTPVTDLIIGAASGVMAQTVSYPFEVVRRRMQVGGITRPDRWLRWGETMRSIWKTSGLKGFYIGLSIGYLKVVPMTAVSFTVWQAGKRVLGV